MRNIIKQITGFALVLALVSCSGGGGGGHHSTPLVTAQSFINKLNDLDGKIGAHYVAKDPTQADGWIVFYDDAFGETVAIDITGLRLSGYSAYEAAADYIDGFLNDYTEFASEFTPAAIAAWAASGFTEDFFEGEVSGFLYEETTQATKDLELAAAMLQNIQLKRHAETIASHYQLSEEQGRKIAKLNSDWNKLAKSRSLTDEDAAAFTEKAFGVNVKEIESAVTAQAEGNEQATEDLINRVSKNLETTPENVKSIISDFLGSNTATESN